MRVFDLKYPNEYTEASADKIAISAIVDFCYAHTKRAISRELRELQHLLSEGKDGYR